MLKTKQSLFRVLMWRQTNQGSGVAEALIYISPPPHAFPDTLQLALHLPITPALAWSKKTTEAGG